MTDQHDDHETEPELRESQLPPADDERIRRLLAEARHTEPMPEAVATRLDGVLASLSADRAQRREDLAHEDHRAPVVDLAARRRRRTAANLLVAAAAVLVVGFGITQVLPDGMSGSDGDAGGHLLPRTTLPVAPPIRRLRRRQRSQRRAGGRAGGPLGVRRRCGRQGVPDPLRALRDRRAPGTPAAAARPQGSAGGVPRTRLSDHRCRRRRRGRGDLRRCPRRDRPADPVRRRPGRRPVPVRRLHPATFDHAHRTLTAPTTGVTGHCMGLV